MKTVTAKQIQEEILSSQQALLKEAHAILQDATKTQAHAKRLKAMGFSASGDILERKMADAERLKHLEDMYSFEYPSLKFIPQEAMSRICQKYGLAIGHVSRYLGEVPEWALAQIEANKHHIPEEEYFDMGKYSQAVLEENRRLLEQGSKEFVSDYPPVTARTIEAGAVRWSLRIYDTGRTLPESAGIALRKKLWIAAPKDQMAMRPGEFVDAQGQIRMVQDPIVCIPVDGGYIVLAAWGEEGSDPQVFNSSNN